VIARLAGRPGAAVPNGQRGENDRTGMETTRRISRNSPGHRAPEFAPEVVATPYVWAL